MQYALHPLLLKTNFDAKKMQHGKKSNSNMERVRTKFHIPSICKVFNGVHSTQPTMKSSLKVTPTDRFSNRTCVTLNPIPLLARRGFCLGISSTFVQYISKFLT